ncbi:MAG: hypothetical protein P8X91_04910 [Candidatus Bathyarchaeota archaeon]|jgi:hypothetical protein
MKKTLLKVESNIVSRKETDKIMWFSMWAVLSVASFGIAWFPMIYFIIKRRNDHFLRQQELEELILRKIEIFNPKKTLLDSLTKNPVKSRNQKLLAFTTIAIIPSFYIFYFLKNDLVNHEKHESVFISRINNFAEEVGKSLNIRSYVTASDYSLGKYIIINLLTFGLASIYWLYCIFNDYNNHFKMQWIIEDQLLRFLKELDSKN